MNRASASGFPVVGRSFVGACAAGQIRERHSHEPDDAVHRRTELERRSSSRGEIRHQSVTDCGVRDDEERIVQREHPLPPAVPDDFPPDAPGQQRQRDLRNPTSPDDGRGTPRTASRSQIEHTSRNVTVAQPCGRRQPDMPVRNQVGRIADAVIDLTPCRRCSPAMQPQREGSST